MLPRLWTTHTLRNLKLTCRGAIHRSFCSDENKKDDPPKPVKPASTASSRLNELLAQMSTEEKPLVSVNIPKPKRLAKRQEAAKDSSSSSSSSSSDEEERPKNIVQAAKKVAESFGGDTRQTEMELLSKLLGGSPEQKAKLSDVIAGMKISKEEDGQKRSDYEQKRSEFVRDSSYRQPRYQPPRAATRKRMETPAMSVNLFGTEPLGIFTDSNHKSVDFLDTWKRLEERELRLAVTHPPSNYFEKMALWTQQGKLWKFPIDNEQDIGPEKDVDFTEHVFLDELLEPWCPPKGPVRHFMELVTVGLSKNPYMTVEEKHEHINYYKEYFESKKKILEQIIVETNDAKAQKQQIVE